MKRLHVLKSALVGGASVLALVHPAAAKVFDIPDGDLAAALDTYMQQSGVQIIYLDKTLRGHRSPGARGNYSEIAALTQVLKGTGFTTEPMPGDIISIVPQEKTPAPVKVAQATRRAPMPAAPMAPTVETVVVTAQHRSENIQSVPIAITALSQQQLTERQIAAGPDLIKEVPNLTFSKTNFTGYNLEIRGIGTQAISVTTDPAVAVAFNDIPFLRNHFFEQEFFDVADVEVLRGPQGTLYGRNATAGVVNIKSALPDDTYEAMLSADFGNYSNRRLEGMLNLPIVGDTLDLRIAGEWTKRDGYTTDTTLDTQIDGRDLWSGRMTLGWKPASNIQAWFVWEHFSEDDNRLRSGKQLCETDYGPKTIDGQPAPQPGPSTYGTAGDYFTQGCLPDASLYSPQAYGAPLGYTLPYVLGLTALGGANPINPYNGVTQSTNLHDIESSIIPRYLAKNDTLEFNGSWNVTPDLTLTSQTGYNRDFLWSEEDFNRFGSNPGLFAYSPGNLHGVIPDPSGLTICLIQPNCGSNIAYGQTCASSAPCGPPVGYFCDPQVGCSDRLVVEDLSTEHAWQFSQEFRLSSNFSGPLNFTAGGNFLHYETVEKYYVFSNALTLIEGGQPIPLPSGQIAQLPYGYQYDNPTHSLAPTDGYIDPNPLGSLDDEGHNYFLSQNPYVLNSYALFGESTYDVASDLKLIAGLRWTDDQKHFLDMPSWVATEGYGYPVEGVVNQQWDQWTGRFVANWTPQLDFTDQTLIYASVAHGYKAGGANPPGAVFVANVVENGQLENANPVHPLTFKPEFIEAFELGTKNTLLDGGLTLNGDVFYYNYSGYQISEIVDRTAINTNFNAHIEGAELETNWEPLPGLKFSLAQGFENTALAGGEGAVDLMDRTAGHPGWYVVKPFVTEASNCIFPGYVAINFPGGSPDVGANAEGFCSFAYEHDLDPLTGLPYVPNPTACNGSFCPYMPAGYPGFNPATAPNEGQGFSKNLAGNQLPNAPHFTTSLTAEYTMPVSDDWAATLHGDFYWQSQQWARVFEDPIDKIHGYSTTNVSLILTSDNGWQVMGYVKNVFNVTAITGTFLNSDDTGLTTNIFLTDPRLYGVRVTKHLDENDGFWGNEYSGADFFTGLFSDADKGRPSLWVTLGGGYAMLDDGAQTFAPPFFSAIAKTLGSPVPSEHPPRGSFDYNAALTYEPDGTDWLFTAAVRYGRSSHDSHLHHQLETLPAPYTYFHLEITAYHAQYDDAFDSDSEAHAIFDFSAGKDIGLGMLGLVGSSNINAGVRIAEFEQSSNFRIHSDPDYVFAKDTPKYWHTFSASERDKRSFHGIGPSVSWNGSASIFGDADSGISFDWGANGAVLFGRQVAQVHHQTTGVHHCKSGLTQGCHIGGTVVHTHSAVQFQTHYQRSGPAQRTRSRAVTVPNLGGFAGVSWNYRNAKVSFGYRADEFFGAMDGGIDTYKSYNRGFFGPYANISIGIGG